MDFLEGFLLGPVWSDTEYETRRHIGLFWLIGWLNFAVFLLFAIFPDKTPSLFKNPLFVPILLFFILTVLSPLVCRLYYKLNIFLKFGILIVSAAKFCLGFVALIEYANSLIVIDLATAPQMLMDYINKSIAGTSEYFSSLGEGAVSMIIGLIAGGLLIVLTFAGIILLASVIPALLLVLMKLIQRGFDLLVKNIIFPISKQIKQ